MLEKLDSYSCIKTVMMGRAIPYAPNVVVTAFSALSHISYRDHFIANVLGKFPAVLVEVWLGHDLLRIQEHWALSSPLFTALSGGGSDTSKKSALTAVKNGPKKRCLSKTALFSMTRRLPSLFGSGNGIKKELPRSDSSLESG